MNIHLLSPEDVADFLAVSHLLRKHDSSWIAPLRSSEARELTSSDSALFIGKVGGSPVGRIAALVSDRMPGVGMLGYFESTNDATVAGALIATAADWLRKRGAKELWAPINGGAHRLHRFLVKGHDTDPFLFEPRNPSYYPSFFCGQGFRPIQTWVSHDVTLDDLERTGFRRMVGAAAKRAGRTHCIEPLDPRDTIGTLNRLYPLMDTAWREHVGYISMTECEFAETASGLLSVMTERHIGVVRDISTNLDVGFGFIYPDFAAEVRALKGEASGWGGWLNTARPDRAVLHTFALLPEARRLGVPFLLLDEAFRTMESDGQRRLVIALVLDSVHIFARQIRPTRTYQLLGRKL